MKEFFKLKFRSVLSLVLVAAMVLMFAGCGEKTQDDNTTAPATSQQEVQEKSFAFQVVDLDGTTKDFTVKYSDEKTIGEALVNEGLISGKNDQYGLMVEVVDGKKYVFEDGAYWALYIDGQYAMTGVDSTPIEDGKVYCFKAEKA